jgi:spermidine synthase
MKPIVTLARERTPDGEELTLTHRGGDYFLNLAGSTLMTSRAHASELALASLACRGLAAETGHAHPRVLIGGLGFGYTLRAALDNLPPGAEVSVWELSAMVLAANQGEVGALAGRPLTDPRVILTQGDVRAALGKEPFDAILLDVDDGPESFSLRRNQRLYSDAGLPLLARSLVAAGVLAVWSMAPDEAFGRRLGAAGFDLQVHGARGGEAGRGVRHTIFLARLRSERGAR